MIVASPNVQENFRTQLFDENKLIFENNRWFMNNSCIGNTLLNKLFPGEKQKFLTKEKIKAVVTRFINSTYLFLGYIEFANYVKKIHVIKEDKSLRKEFEGRLIVIDEIHNLKSKTDDEFTHSAKYLKILIENVRELKLVFLTATPMFNDALEIVWILNLLRLNDKREEINAKKVFTESGSFVVDKDTGEELGLRKLIEMSRGYVSFIRGENPYSFPYRIWPKIFRPDKSYIEMKYNEKYPNYSATNKTINRKNVIKYLDLYVNKIERGGFQEKAYEKVKNKFITKENTRLTYDQISPMIQVLNFAFPTKDEDDNTAKLYGGDGLKRIMVNVGNKLSYKSEYNGIFKPENIGEYSHKLKTISDEIYGSDGIILIYSQFIEGGLVPVALMLEEMGYDKYPNSGKNLLKNEKRGLVKSPKYVIISGNERYSENTEKEMSVVSSDENNKGELIKVVLISRAGSEGLDFKNIRQVHVLDPWYNLNRNEQIVGRGVRLCSHKKLRFSMRNVCIYYHATELNEENEEACDMYVYRYAEEKALKIAKVERVLKRNAVDCMLNIQQTMLTEKNINRRINILLSNGIEVEYDVGDKSYSSLCNYAEECEYECINNEDIGKSKVMNEIDMSTFNVSYLEYNTEFVITKLKKIFKEEFPIISMGGLLKVMGRYPRMLVEYSLDKIIREKIKVYDYIGREGIVEKFGEYIIFKPLEIASSSTVFDRIHPVHFKHSVIKFNTEGKFRKEKNGEEKDLEEDMKKISINESIEDRLIGKLMKYYDKSIQEESKYDNMIKNAIKERNNEILYNHVLHRLIDGKLDKVSLKKALCGSIFDELSNDEIINYINTSYNRRSRGEKHENKNKEDMSNALYEYIESKMFEVSENKYIIIQNLGSSSGNNLDIGTLYVLEGNVWEVAKRTHMKELHEYRMKTLSEFQEKISSQKNNVIGFMDKMKNNVVFKIKDLRDKQAPGYVCEQVVGTEKTKMRKYVENLFDLYDLDKKNLYEWDEKKKVEKKKEELCVYLELLLRYAEVEERNSEIWFLNVFSTSTMRTYRYIEKKGGS